MKKFLLLFAAFGTLSSCNLFDNYGKKVEFGKSEVYYKGSGVTEADAQKLGDYLVDQKYFETKKPKTAQLTIDDGDYMVHFVVDKDKMTDAARLNFWKWQFDLAKEIFNNQPVRIALANDQLKDIEVLNPIARYGIGKSSSLYYDNSEIKKSDAKKVLDFLSGIKLLGADKEADAFYQKEDGVPTVRVVVNPDKITADLLPVFSYWQTLLREQVFDGGKAKIVLTSTQYEDMKPLPKLTQEQRTTFENEEKNESTDQKQTNENTIDSLTTQTKVSGVLRLKND